MFEKNNPYTIREKDIENARLGYWDEDEYPDDDELEYGGRYGSRPTRRYGSRPTRRTYWDEDYDLPGFYD